MVESIEFLKSIVEQRDSALEICHSLQTQVADMHHSPFHQVSEARSTQTFSSRTTVGLTLKGSTIVGLVVGGPAFLCGKLNIGDVIVKVDGTPVTTDNLHELLLGTDCPGSSVTLTVMKSADNISAAEVRCETSIELRRVRQEQLADQRSLQEMLEGLLVVTYFSPFLRRAVRYEYVLSFCGSNHKPAEQTRASMFKATFEPAKNSGLKCKLRVHGKNEILKKN